MSPQTTEMVKDISAKTISWLSMAFDRTADWVSRLSWWKFLLFAIITMASGSILQETLFSNEESVVISKKNTPKKHNQIHKPIDADSTVEINNNGIHIRKNNGDGKTIEIDENGVHIANDNTPQNEDSSSDASPSDPKVSPPALPVPPEKPAAPVETKIGGSDIHIKLPPEIAQEISDEIDNAVADAADEEVKTYRKKSSQWFMNFVLLSLFGLFGMKALMGGKVRAEEMAREANVTAEKESLLRQVSEAQMQMMQAQVEPHFLFNTLASVEYLIETDPPRAAAMQRSLIAYLRAVLPQMRENGVKTNLGREADMVKSYLDLLKMRMEDRLEIDFIMPEGLRSASFPPMMLQSLVENAIKHGLEVKAEGGTLQFRAEVAHNKLRVTVTDNGLGFGAVPSNGTGLGLQNIRERLKLLYKEKAQMIVTPNQPTGVCVTIEIPYELA
jgi:hypothetical protein